MNKEIIRKWNERVQPEDTVYHLGDFCFGRAEVAYNLLSRLNGKITLIVGNHDKLKALSFDVAGVGFKEILPYAEYNGWYLRHRPFNRDKLLCGHVHGLWKRIDNVINCSVDVWNFYPQSFEELMTAVPEDAYHPCGTCGRPLHRLEQNANHWKGRCDKRDYTKI